MDQYGLGHQGRKRRLDRPVIAGVGRVGEVAVPDDHRHPAPQAAVPSPRPKASAAVLDEQARQEAAQVTTCAAVQKAIGGAMVFDRLFSIKPTSDGTCRLTTAALLNGRQVAVVSVLQWDDERQAWELLEAKLKADPAVYAMRGSVYHGAKQYAEAKADYPEALKRNPNERSALNNLAWLQATCPDAEYRDGASAVKLATKVCELTNWRVKAYASTLAAAHAESGNFEKAIEIAGRYTDGNVKLYRDKKPVREE